MMKLKLYLSVHSARWSSENEGWISNDISAGPIFLWFSGRQADRQTGRRRCFNTASHRITAWSIYPSIWNGSCLSPQGIVHYRDILWAVSSSTVSLLGLMAKIKCSICSYQFNIWYAFHSVGSYINLIFDFGSRERGLPHPDHGLPRRCTTAERGP